MVQLTRDDALALELAPGDIVWLASRWRRRPWPPSVAWSRRSSGDRPLVARTLVDASPQRDDRGASNSSAVSSSDTSCHDATIASSRASVCLTSTCSPTRTAKSSQPPSLRGGSLRLPLNPEADTPGCTTQACGVRDRAATYETVNAVVLGVSPDSPKKLRGSPHMGSRSTLLGDEDHSVAEKYGVWLESRCIAEATRA